jgi:ABC-type transport system involved in multi-copper enzyme maturation permease subunit
VLVWEEDIARKENAMNLRNLYLLNTIISLGFALGFFLISPFLLSLFGMEDTPEARTLAQLIAVELVVGGVTTLLARDVTDAKATSAINTGNFLAGLLGTVIALRATLTGVMGWFGYVVAAVYLFVAVAFGYFQFLKKAR